VEQGLTSLMTDYQLELGRYDPDAESITYYGRDEVLALDGEGRLRSGFDGSWICLNGEPLYVEVVSSSASSVEYMAHVYYDGEEAYLMISCDRDTGDFSLNGVRKVDLNNAVNSLASSRSRLEPEAGKTIVPIYKVTNLNNGETKNESGEKIYFSTRTSITRELLPSGSYLSTAVISDSRGDNYYSRVIGSEVSGKTMTGWKLDDRFMGRDY
jgi:hypothetical protein